MKRITTISVRSLVTNKINSTLGTTENSPNTSFHGPGYPLLELKEISGDLLGNIILSKALNPVGITEAIAFLS